MAVGVAVLGFIGRETMTWSCSMKNGPVGEVLTMTYDRLLEIYFQNPEFGYYFLRLSSDRLLQNISRLEGVIEQNKKSKLQLTDSK